MTTENRPCGVYSPVVDAVQEEPATRSLSATSGTAAGWIGQDVGLGRLRHQLRSQFDERRGERRICSTPCWKRASRRRG